MLHLLNKWIKRGMVHSHVVLRVNVSIGKDMLPLLSEPKPTPEFDKAQIFIRAGPRENMICHQSHEKQWDTSQRESEDAKESERQKVGSPSY